MIEVNRVSHGYGDLQVLAGITFSVERGEIVAVVGPSGCGKTTLLKIAGGLLHPSSGEVRVNGQDAQTARKRGTFGFVFQRPVLLPWRTVRRNVELPIEILKPVAGPHRSVHDLLREVGLGGFDDSLPAKLSGGMQHRVALARALVCRPDVLLMDEPFTGLDELLRERLDVEVLALTERLGQTLVLATHDVAEAVLLADRVLVLSDRPTQIRKVISVDLGRPRERARRSPRHLELIEELRTILRT